MKFALTLFPTLGASAMEAQVAPSFRAFAESLKRVKQFPGKDRMPLICPMTFNGTRTEKKSLRHDAGVNEIYGICGDHDAGTLGVKRAEGLMKKAGIEGAIYTTPRHTEAAPRLRIVCPFAKSTKDHAAHRAAVERLNHVLEGELTDESFTLSQSFYIGRVKGVLYQAVYVKGRRRIDEAEDIPRRAGSPVRGNGEHKGAPGEAALIAAIVKGEEIHPPARELMNLWRREGRDDAKIVADLLGLVEQSGRDSARVEAAKGEVLRLLEGAREKGIGAAPEVAVRKLKLALVKSGAPSLPQPEAPSDTLPLSDIKVMPRERAPIIEGWLYERVVLLHAADGGSGKSYLGIHESMMVGGGYDCGLGWKVTPGKVLLYSGEDDADTIRARMRAYCSYYGWSLDTFRERVFVVDRSEADCVLYSEGQYGVGDFTPEWGRLVRTIERVNPAHVVIDNASHVFNANENNRALVRHFLSGLTALRRSVNLLGHVNKVTAGAGLGANAATSYSGSTAWHNTVRARRSQALDEGKLDGSVTITKSNYGPTGTSMRYGWDQTAKVFVPRAVIARASAQEHHAVLLAAVKALEGRPLSMHTNTPTYIGRVLQATGACPAGITTRALDQWLKQQVARGAIEECENERSRGRKGVSLRLSALGQRELAQC